MKTYASSQPVLQGFESLHAVRNSLFTSMKCLAGWVYTILSVDEAAVPEEVTER
jgi:hypothetical protein